MENETNVVNETNGEKKGNGFNKKWLIIIIIAVVAVAIGIVFLVMGNKGTKIDLSKTQLGHYLPELPSGNGKVTYDTEKYLDIDLENVKQEEYKNYTKECEQKGFNIDVSSGSTFEAYNEESYRIYMYTMGNDQMHISLTAPTEIKKITWPTSQLAESIPTPKFDGGYINTDKSNEINITIGNLTKEDYDKFVNECSAKGYNVNYEKREKNYKADNNAGNHLEVSYYGGRRVNIHLKGNEANTNSSATTTETPKVTETPKTTDSPANTETTKPVEQETTNNTSSNSNGISQDFQSAMDSYEDFMNEYVEFMKKYKANSTDLSLLSQYGTIMQKYTEQVSAFEKWDSKSMSTEEAKYYIDVQSRVNKKLLEITE